MTAIEWTDITDNIIVAVIGGWWCRMISEGCVNCYAGKLNQSDYFGGNHLPYTGNPPELKLRTEIIDGWARMTKPKKHFVASMTDIFGDWVKTEWVFRFLDGMVAAPRQTFQLLTKRADIMQAVIIAYCAERGIKTLPPNIWGGVSVENQKRGDERIPLLLGTPFAVRFLSVEPLLGPVVIPWQPDYSHNTSTISTIPGIDWVIVGGESGPSARPCNIEWIRSIVAQCKAAGVPCFVKQLGSVPVYDSLPDSGWRGEIIQSAPPRNLADYKPSPMRLAPKHKKGGDPSEWPEDLRVRKFPNL